MTEESQSLPNIESGAAPRQVQKKRSFEEIEAKADASMAKRDQINNAEAVDKQSDRKERIDQHLIDNDFFGFKPTGDFDPYDPEVLNQLSTLLVDMETRRRKSKPDFDITSDWDEAKTLKFFNRKYVEREDLEEGAEKKEDDRDGYFKAVATVRKNNPNIDNLSLCRKLATEHKADIPPEHLAKLQAFIQIQSLATTPEDAAIVTAKINALSFDGGIPSPRLFIETAILADDTLSESYRETVATHFNIPNPRVKTGGQVDQTLDARDEDGKPLYTADNPVDIGKNTKAYENPDGSRAVLVNTGDGRSREIPWKRGEAPDVIGTKISMAKIWTRNEWSGNTDFFGESVDIETDILSQTDPQKLTKVRNVINAIFGGTRGYDGIIIQDHEADFIGWFNQYLATKGDAAIGDFDKGMAGTNRINLGLHPNGDLNEIDYEVLRAAALYAKGQYGSGEPDYYALQRHLHDLFPEKDIPLTGENAETSISL